MWFDVLQDVSDMRPAEGTMTEYITEPEGLRWYELLRQPRLMLTMPCMLHSVHNTFTNMSQCQCPEASTYFNTFLYDVS